MSPPEKIALCFEGEPQDICCLGKNRKVGEKALAAILDKLHRALMVTIIAIEKGNQRSGINDDA